MRVAQYQADVRGLTASLSPEEKYKIVAGNVIDYFGMDPDILNKPE